MAFVEEKNRASGTCHDTGVCRMLKQHCLVDINGTHERRFDSNDILVLIFRWSCQGRCDWHRRDCQSERNPEHSGCVNEDDEKRLTTRYLVTVTYGSTRHAERIAFMSCDFNEHKSRCGDLWRPNWLLFRCGRIG
jgi:hypothetical protein